MAEMDNLIGSHLSLISQQDVRYDGILFSINSQALAKGEDPPLRPKAFFAPNAATEQSNSDSNDSSVNAPKKGFKVSKK